MVTPAFETSSSENVSSTSRLLRGVVEKFADNGGFLVDNDHERCRALVLQRLYAIFAFSFQPQSARTKSFDKEGDRIDEVKSNSIHRPVSLPFSKDCEWARLSTQQKQALCVWFRFAFCSWFLSCRIKGKRQQGFACEQCHLLVCRSLLMLPLHVARNCLSCFDTAYRNTTRLDVDTAVLSPPQWLLAGILSNAWQATKDIWWLFLHGQDPCCVWKMCFFSSTNCRCALSSSMTCRWHASLLRQAIKDIWWLFVQRCACLLRLKEVFRFVNEFCLILFCLSCILLK